MHTSWRELRRLLDAIAPYATFKVFLNKSLVNGF
jgi:hypothetical protein